MHAELRTRDLRRSAKLNLRARLEAKSCDSRPEIAGLELPQMAAVMAILGIASSAASLRLSLLGLKIWLACQSENNARFGNEVVSDREVRGLERENGEGPTAWSYSGSTFVPLTGFGGHCYLLLGRTVCGQQQRGPRLCGVSGP